jgi:hypothetical protein
MTDEEPVRSYSNMAFEWRLLLADSFTALGRLHQATGRPLLAEADLQRALELSRDP